MISGQLNLTTSMPLEDAVWLSLNTPLGTFWQQPGFGSELHLMQRETMDENTPDRVAAMARRSVQWLVSLDRLRNLVIIPSVPNRGAVSLAIQATGINGTPLSLSIFVPVGVVP